MSEEIELCGIRVPAVDLEAISARSGVSQEIGLALLTRGSIIHVCLIACL
jgi:hypothetical protein